MNIVFMGTPDFAVTTLKSLYASGHNVTGVFTQPDRPKGRGYKCVPPPVKALAMSHLTPVFQPESLKKDLSGTVAILRQLKPHCIVVAAYGCILPREVLRLPMFGCINVHASLLPKLRGAAPIQRAILNGDTETGITIQQMDIGLDTGDILLQKSTPIGENETSSELFQRLAQMGADMTLEVLTAFERGTATCEPQNDAESTYAKMITKDMCPLDFRKPVFELHKQICALSDSPGAVVYLNGKRIKIYHSEIVSREKPPVEAGSFIGGKVFDVACIDGVLRFNEIQAEGSKRMNSSAYLNGRPIAYGTKFDEMPDSGSTGISINR